MSVPNWYSLVLLSLASFRVWRLLALDDVLDWPRRKLLRLGSWKEDGDLVPKDYRQELGKFTECPWCFGFWISLIWWGSYQWSPHWSVVIAAPWAISAVVGLIGSKLQ